MDWGVKQRIVTGDSWYDRVENLKFLRNQKFGFIFGVEKNRTVWKDAGKYCPVSSLEITEEGLLTQEREFGWLKLFRKDFKKEDSKHYILYLQDTESLQLITRKKRICLNS